MFEQEIVFDHFLEADLQLGLIFGQSSSSNGILLADELRIVFDDSSILFFFRVLMDFQVVYDLQYNMNGSVNLFLFLEKLVLFVLAHVDTPLEVGSFAQQILGDQAGLLMISSQ